MTHLKIALSQCLILVFLMITTISCIKDRDPGATPEPNPGPGPNPEPNPNLLPHTIAFGSLVVNEVLSTGSVLISRDGGSTADWFEIYNPGTTDITLDSGKWYLTDNLGDKTKYLIPSERINKLVVPAKGFTVVFCDGVANTNDQLDVHTSFSLSAGGEEVGIVYQNGAGEKIWVDSLSYPTAISGKSYGRQPNGGANFFQLTPSPNASNN